MKQSPSKQKGVTLIELLISVAIFSGVVVLFGQFSADVFLFNRIYTAQLEAENDLRTILSPFPSEVRSAAPSDRGDYPILLAGEKEFIFYTDTDFNGSRERVRYFVEGTTFKKGILESQGDPEVYDPQNEIIIDVVKDIVNAHSYFTYYDSLYNGEDSTAALVQPVLPNLVRLVDITVAVDADPNQPPKEVSTSTKVSIRNLKDNL
jgi:prepilin-type N-terminal cleavage/methylation domain-containing protein